MNTTVRNRAAALGIAAVAGIAGVGAAGGSGLASTSPQAGSGSNAEVNVALGTQSDGHPANASDYADELVRAWGVGSDAEVGEHATPGVVEALSEHGDEFAAKWDRITADGAAGSSYVVYKNKTTGELMTFTVNNEAAAHDEHQAVHHIQFKDRDQPRF